MISENVTLIKKKQTNKQKMKGVVGWGYMKPVWQNLDNCSIRMMVVGGIAPWFSLLLYMFQDKIS